MTWDATFASWEYYGVSSQPNAILVTAAGEPVGSWPGRLPIEEVEAALADAS